MTNTQNYYDILSIMEELQKVNERKEFDEYIDDSLSAMMKEILKHFCVRFRKSDDDDDDDSRYLYNTKEVETFKKMYADFKKEQKEKYELLETEKQRKNFHWIANLKIEPLYENNKTTPWAYRIYRVTPSKK